MVKKFQFPLDIQWNEGLLIYPQHFQQQRRVIHQSITNALRIAQPFYWGVFSLSIDTTSLASDIVRIEELEAVMPDGLCVSVTPNNPLELNIKDIKERCVQEPKKIFLCVPKEYDGSANNRDDAPRYGMLDDVSCKFISGGQKQLRLGIWQRFIPSLLVADRSS